MPCVFMPSPPLPLAKVAIPGCSKAPLEVRDIEPNPAATRLLMANPWHNEREVVVWKKPPTRPLTP